MYLTRNQEYGFRTVGSNPTLSANPFICSSMTVVIIVSPGVLESWRHSLKGSL